MVKFLENFPQYFLHIFVGHQLMTHIHIQLFHCKTLDVYILYSMISLKLRMDSHLVFCPVCNFHSLRVHATKKSFTETRKREGEIEREIENNTHEVKLHRIFHVGKCIIIFCKWYADRVWIYCCVPFDKDNFLSVGFLFKLRS